MPASWGLDSCRGGGRDSGARARAGWEVGVASGWEWAGTLHRVWRRGVSGAHTSGTAAGAWQEFEMRKIESYGCRPRWGRRPEPYLHGSKSFQDDHRPTAVRTGVQGTAGVRLRFGLGGWCGLASGGEQLETQRQQGGAAPVGEESEMPDAHKSPRQHVQKEAAQKLGDG